MLRATLKSLLGRKLRLVLSALAVVLGVSFVAGALVLTDTLRSTFDTLFTTVYKNVAVDIRGTSLSPDTSNADSSAGTRRTVPPSVLDTIRRLPGVAEAEPQVTGPAVLVGVDGKPVSRSGGPAFGRNWLVPGRLTQIQLSAGRGPAAPDEVVVDLDLAAKAGKHVGDGASVLTKTGQQQVRIVGLSQYPDGKGSLGGETYVFFTTPTAQRVLDVPGSYSEIVAAAAGVSQQQLRDRIAAVLPGGTEAITGSALATEQSNNVKDNLGFLTTFLLVFAGVALFVGAFIIFNTFSILVAQRTRELALLRALGASRRQVTRSVLVESVAVGLIASALGLGLGIGVALGLKALFGAFGAGLPAGPTVISVRTVVASFAVGVLVTAAAALIPARRAARVAPVAALRDADGADRPLTRQTVGGAAILLLGAAGMAVGLTGHGLAILGVGTLLAFIGIAMLSPLLSRPLTRLLGKPMARGVPGRLGRDNAMRNPRRTASTAAALMIGLALVSAVGVLGASLNSSIRKVVNQALGADYVLNTSTSGIAEPTLGAVRRLPGVATVTGLRSGEVSVNGSKSGAIAVPRDALGTTISLQQKQGSVTDLGPTAVLVADKTAHDKAWSIGTVLSIRFGDGRTERLRLTGTYQDNQLVGSYVLDQSQAVAHFRQPLYDAVLVKAAAGTNLDTVRGELTAATKANPNIELQDRGQFAKQTTNQIDQIVQFLTVLLVLSVLIAVLGIVNTLALSVLERTRELGLLRVVGMTRRQMKRMVRVESVVIATFGGLLGLAVGAVFGIALQRALVGQGVTDLRFPVAQLLAYLAAAVLAGVLAAWLPARRASRLNMLTAVAAQ